MYHPTALGWSPYSCSTDPGPYPDPDIDVRIRQYLLRAYFGYLDPQVTFCLLARVAGTSKLGLAPLPNPLRVGHTTIIVG